MQTAAFARQKARRADSGLSLVELLLAIMILGIIGSLAMMLFGNGLSQEAEKQRDRRNAQEIANMAAMAAMAGAAGAPYFVAGDEEATVGNLRTGSAPSRGIFKNRVFQIPAMSDEEVQRAMSYLVLNDTDLVYDSTLGQ